MDKKGKNLIAVRVNNLWKPDVAPRAGEHVFSGGIYRNVRLVKKDIAIFPGMVRLLRLPIWLNSRDVVQE